MDDDCNDKKIKNENNRTFNVGKGKSVDEENSQNNSSNNGDSSLFSIFENAADPNRYSIENDTSGFEEYDLDSLKCEPDIVILESEFDFSQHFLNDDANLLENLNYFVEISQNAHRYDKNSADNNDESGGEGADCKNDQSRPRVYECEFCKETYPERETLNDHRKTKHLRNINSFPHRYKCNFCENVYFLKHHLISHLAKKHSQRMITSRQYKCEFCQMVFSAIGDLYKHRRMHHSSNATSAPYNCNFCDETFTSLETIGRHCRKVHHYQSWHTINIEKKLNDVNTQSDDYANKVLQSDNAKSCEEFGKKKLSQSESGIVCDLNSMGDNQLRATKSNESLRHKNEQGIGEQRTNKELQICDVDSENNNERKTNLALQAGDISSANLCEQRKCEDKPSGDVNSKNIVNSKSKKDLQLNETSRNISKEKKINANHSSISDNIKTTNAANFVSSVFRCGICNRSFLTENRMVIHQITAHENTLLNVDYFKCEICENVFLTEESFNNHKKRKHNISTNDRRKKKEDVKGETVNFGDFQCDICNIKYSSRPSLNKHRKSKHNGNNQSNLRCVSNVEGDLSAKGETQLEDSNNKSDECDRIDASEDLKIRNTIDEAPDGTKSNADLQNENCVDENEQITNVDENNCENVAKRISVESSLFDNTLSECDSEQKTNSDGSQLSSSPNNATNIFRCEICQHISATEFRMIRHQMLMHAKTTSNVFQFTCDICEKIYFSKVSLTKHRKQKHNALDPIGGSSSLSVQYKCNLCENTYLSKESLNRHRRTKHYETYQAKNFSDLYDSNMGASLSEEFQPSDADNNSITCGDPNQNEDSQLYNAENDERVTNDELQHIYDINSEDCNEQTKNEDEQSLFICDICEQHFTTEFRLMRHRMTAHANVTSNVDHFKCDICDNIYFSTNTLKKHRRKKHNLVDAKQPTPGLPYQCDICENTYALKCTLNVHRKRKHNLATECSYIRNVKLDNYVCRFCLKEFIDRQRFYNHCKAIHYEELSDGCSIVPDSFPTIIINENKDENGFACFFCDQVFPYKYSLQHHLNQHERTIKCPDCGVDFTSRRTFKRHAATHEKGYYFNCEICFKLFKNAANLYAHCQQVHTDMRTHQCDICFKTFSCRRYVVKHINATHRGLKRKWTYKSHQCAICDKVFRGTANYYRHMQTHTGERPHECTYCGKKFARLSYLNIHLRMHTGITSHVCTICGKKFIMQTGLNKHIVSIHEKCYCSVCDMNFKNRNEKLHHMRDVHGVKYACCNVCGKLCRGKYDLNIHMLIHDSPLSYHCAVCSQSFKMKKSLSKHFQKHHP